jgi:hypothetical protein
VGRLTALIPVSRTTFPIVELIAPPTGEAEYATDGPPAQPDDTRSTVTDQSVSVKPDESRPDERARLGIAELPRLTLAHHAGETSGDSMELAAWFAIEALSNSLEE